MAGETQKQYSEVIARTQSLSQNQAVMKEQISNLDKKLEQYIQESKEFHIELMSQLRQIGDDRVAMATLKEKVKLLEKIVWTALAAGITGMAIEVFKLITGRY